MSTYLFGLAGNDTITGGQNDDLIEGGRGNDILSGGDGADRFFWKSSAGSAGTGDGLDTVDGGSGIDQQYVFGDSGDEGWTFGAVGATAVLQQTSSAASQISMTNVEFVLINLRGGNDRLTIGDLSSTSVTGVNIIDGAGDDTIDATNSSVPIKRRRYSVQRGWERHHPGQQVR